MNPAEVLVQERQGEIEMIELEPGNALDIALKEDAHGRDRVVVTLEARMAVTVSS